MAGFVLDDEVLIHVRVASVNPADWHLMRGRPFLVRLAGYGLRRPKSPVPGSDVAGGRRGRQQRDTASTW